MLKAVLHAHGDGSDGAGEGAARLTGYAGEAAAAGHPAPPPSVSEEAMRATVGKGKNVACETRPLTSMVFPIQRVDFPD